MARSAAIFFFQAEDGIRDRNVTGVQTCALPIAVATAAPDRSFGSFEQEAHCLLPSREYPAMILLYIEERRGLKIPGRDDPLGSVIVMASRSTVMRYYWS